MSYRVVFSPEAIQDFNDLHAYILPEAGAKRARDYIARLYDHCLDFATFPERGTRRDDLAPGLRIVGYRRRAAIAFKVEGDDVTILRVFHHGRNIAFPGASDLDEPDDV
jgi:plasmid stabilization system protein ParE